MPVWLRRLSGGNDTLTLDGGTEQLIANEKKQSAPAIRVSMEKPVWLGIGALEKFIVADYNEKLGGKKVISRHLMFCRRTCRRNKRWQFLERRLFAFKPLVALVYAA